MKPTSFRRDFIKTVVEAKIAEPYALRHFDVLSAHEAGMSQQQIAIKYGVTKKTVWDIIKKYS